MRTPHRILVTGGAGYVGAILVPKLMQKGFEVKILDLYLYGEHVFDGYRSHPQLEQIKGDIRDHGLVRDSLRDCDTVIHLACISNDPSCDLDPALTKSINYDAFLPLVRICKQEGIARFLFASSSSVYGISDQPSVTEDHPRLPITDYNRYKAMCEDILAQEQSSGCAAVVIRPATICGYSPRLRLDLTVNILTNHAFNTRQITVFGGDQHRPNIHIQDITDLFIQLVEEPLERIAGKVFNAGCQNLTLRQIAGCVKETIEQRYPDKAPVPVTSTPSDDVRSYRISSEKLTRELGFAPKRTIQDAVVELCQAFRDGKVPDPLTSRRYYNIAMMKEAGLR